MRTKPILALAFCLSLAFCATSQQKLANSREKDPRYQYNMGLFYLNGNELDTAVRYLDKSLALSQGYFPAWNALGLAKSMQGKFQDSAAAYRKCLEINPKFTEARNNLGTIYQELNFLDKAEAEFKGALEDTTYASRELPSYNLARLYLTMERLDDALEYARKCVQIKPRFAMAYNLEGLILEKKGDLNGALESYEEAVKIVPGEPTFNFNLGVACFKSGSLERATEIFEKIFPLVKDDATKAKIREYLELIRKQEGPGAGR
jgi:Tfp pilus assembly protein PilF